MAKRARRGQAKRPRVQKPKRRVKPKPAPEDAGEVTSLADEIASHPETGPYLSAGDIDADWMRAESSGEEAAGGSEPTPDQDVVDEIGHALGVEQESDEEVKTSDEILRARTLDRWRLEREAADEEDEQERRRSGGETER